MTNTPPPSVCIGFETLRRLREEGAVCLNGVVLVAADDFYASEPPDDGQQVIALVARVRELEQAAQHGEIWTSAALDCKNWHWDQDQREAAEHSLEAIRRAVAGAPPLDVTHGQAVAALAEEPK